MRGYAICCTRRSGSTLLCQALTSTGVLGRPREWFNVPGVRYDHPDYPEEPDAVLEALVKLSMTPNGVYGLKVHGFHFDSVAPPGWAERLPNLAFIFLRRRDLLRQALSDVRAMQTNAYRSTHAVRGDPRYDGQAIGEALIQLARYEARWRFFFARNGIEPFELAYESFLAAPQAVLDGVARLVGLAKSPEMTPGLIDVRVQRDALTEAWRERFLAENADLARFD